MSFLNVNKVIKKAKFFFFLMRSITNLSVMDVSNSFQALCWNFLLLLFACCRSCGQIYPCLESHSVLNGNCFYFLLLQVSHSALDLLENKPKLEGQEQISKMQTCSE